MMRKRREEEKKREEGNHTIQSPNNTHTHTKWIESELADKIIHAQSITSPDNAHIRWPKQKKLKTPRRITNRPQIFPIRDQTHIQVAQAAGLNRKHCSACGINSTYRNYHVHHLDGNANNNDSENLVVLCPSCHLNITHGYALPLVLSELDGVKMEAEGVIDEV
jgi:hypothetical protein